MYDFFFRPREANFSPKFRRTQEETAEQNASQGILLMQLFPHVCSGPKFRQQTRQAILSHAPLQPTNFVK